MDERAGTPVAALTAEIASRQDDVADSVADNPTPALVWDVTVHHADLHEALGLGRPPEPLWLPVLETLAPPPARGRSGPSRLREPPLGCR